MAVRDELEALLSESVDMLRANLRQIQKQMKNSTTLDVVLNNELARVARCVSSLSAEARKAGAKAAHDAEATNQEQRVVIAEQWLAALPPELLRPAIERLRAGLRRAAVAPVKTSRPARRDVDDEA